MNLVVIARRHSKIYVGAALRGRPGNGGVDSDAQPGRPHRGAPTFDSLAMT